MRVQKGCKSRSSGSAVVRRSRHSVLRRHLADELKQIQIRGQGPVLARQLYAARAVEGVESARPIYAEWPISSWKNPQTGKIYAAQVLAFDPDQPVFLFPEVREHLEALRQPDTALSDRRGRRLLGFAPAGTLTELSRREIRVIGNFSLGRTSTATAPCRPALRFAPRQSGSRSRPRFRTAILPSARSSC